MCYQTRSLGVPTTPASTRLPSSVCSPDFGIGQPRLAWLSCAQTPRPQPRTTPVEKSSSRSCHLSQFLSFVALNQRRVLKQIITAYQSAFGGKAHRMNIVIVTRPGYYPAQPRKSEAVSDHHPDELSSKHLAAGYDRLESQLRLLPVRHQ